MKRLIVIEGIDGCGKQTQTAMLYDAFVKMGYKTFKMSFPNYDSPSSAPIKMYLGGEFGDANSLDAYQASVLFAADRICTIKQLQKTLDEYDIVIFDRYVTANMLHQAGKIVDQKQKEKFLDWVNDLEFNLLKLPKPTDVIFLNLHYETSLKLIKERANLKSGTTKDVLESDVDYLKNSYNTAELCINKFGWKTIDCNADNFGLKTRDQIHNLIKETLNLK